MIFKNKINGLLQGKLFYFMLEPRALLHDILNVVVAEEMLFPFLFPEGRESEMKPAL